MRIHSLIPCCVIFVSATLFGVPVHLDLPTCILLDTSYNLTEQYLVNEDAGGVKCLASLSQSWASPALARLVLWTMDRGSLWELLLFSHSGFFLLVPVQPQLALMKQGRNSTPKSTWHEPAAYFNAQNIFGVRG